MWNRTTKTDKGSRGQVLPMAALMMVVLVAFTGLAIDAGRLFIAKAELVRAVDAAALAGTLELPDLTKAQTKITTYMAQNEPTAHVDAPISPTERQIKVTGTKTVDVIFMRVFGISSVDVSASATAGFGVLAVDTVMAIDATGSMGVDSSGHACSGSGCPIYEAKNAAKSFTDTLLSGSTTSSETLVGVTPYRGCFNAPNLFSACIPIASMVQPLSNNKSTVDSKINAITSLGGTGTNICNGLLEANQILYGVGHHDVSNMLRIVVILSDGDNTYNLVANGNPTPSTPPPSKTATPNPAYQLPSACRPPTPNKSTDDTGSSCMPAQPHQISLDNETMTLVNTMKSNGVEFYVVGFGVCGSPDSQVKSDSYCSHIGNGDTDTVANRRLLRCIASSSPGTNNHYFEATKASDLPGIFTNIARLIGFRLIQ